MTCFHLGLVLSVQVDPDTEGPGLPMKESEEFRPFSRRLPEFKFWVASTRAVLYAFGMTFFEVGRRERGEFRKGGGHEMCEVGCSAFEVERQMKWVL